MEFWLDTSDVNCVIHANSLGILQGVTTNPSILSLSKMSPKTLVKELLAAQDGFVAVQVLSDDFQEILKEAKMLFALSRRILIKIPVTQNGIRAISLLTQQGLPILATAIFDLPQALLAFKAGANYLAPYLGRISDSGQDPVQVISKMQAMKLNYGFQGKIMGAGIRDLTTAMACVEMGISAITLSEKIFNELIKDRQPTLAALDKFSKDWSTSIYSQGSFYSLHDSV